MLTPPIVTEIHNPVTHENKKQPIPEVRAQVRPGTLADFSVFFQLLITYRVPMMVQDAIVFHRHPEDLVYYRCPRCQQLLDREFMAYCSGCGQSLNWRDYKKAKQTYFEP